MAPPDPYTTSRKDFTQYLLDKQCPGNADERFKKLFNNQQHILKLLVEHDAMQPNINQTYMTPAASKNKVYFMWDFVGRTMGYLTAIESGSSSHPMFSDAESRGMMAKTLILDTSDKLDNMIPNRTPGSFEFGDEIKRLARET